MALPPLSHTGRRRGVSCRTDLLPAVWLVLVMCSLPGVGAGGADDVGAPRGAAVGAAWTAAGAAAAAVTGVAAMAATRALGPRLGRAVVIDEDEFASQLASPAGVVASVPAASTTDSDAALAARLREEERRSERGRKRARAAAAADPEDGAVSTATTSTRGTGANVVADHR